MSDEPQPYLGPERRTECYPLGNCPHMADVNQRFNDGTDRMKRIEESIKELKTSLDANSALTAHNAANNAEILDILTLGKSFFRIAGYFGTFIKWGAGIATAVIGLWLTFKYGKPPP